MLEDKRMQYSASRERKEWESKLPTSVIRSRWIKTRVSGESEGRKMWAKSHQSFSSSLHFPKPPEQIRYGMEMGLHGVSREWELTVQEGESGKALLRNPIQPSSNSSCLYHIRIIQEQEIVCVGESGISKNKHNILFFPFSHLEIVAQVENTNSMNAAVHFLTP